MSHKSVSILWSSAVAMTAILVIAGSAVAETRPDVLERIKPVGEVTVAGQPKTAAPAEEAAPAAEEVAPATEETAAAAPEAAAPAEEAPAAAAGDAATLAQAKGCMACHQATAPGAPTLGPLYADVAAKYKGDAAAEDMLVDKVIKGGDGNWETSLPAMPPNAVTPEEARTLVKWVLTQ